MDIGFQHHHPEGMAENSPAFERRDSRAPDPVRLKRRVIVVSPFGTETDPVAEMPAPVLIRYQTTAYQAPDRRKKPKQIKKRKSVTVKTVG